MTTAIDKRWKLKRRIEDYLVRGQGDRARGVKEAVQILNGRFPRSGVIGGLIRDVALGGAANFKSDVDVVIDAPVEEVGAFASEMKAIPNRFGGYSTQLADQKLDFWAMKETWTYKSGLVDVESLSDVTSSTFFILDAAVYDFESAKLHLHRDYISHLTHRILEINVRRNPSVQGNLVRAVRRLLKEDLSPGSELQRFLVENLDARAFDKVIEKEWELYRYSYAVQFDDNVKLLKALLSRKHRRNYLQFELEF